MASSEKASQPSINEDKKTNIIGNEDLPKTNEVKNELQDGGLGSAMDSLSLQQDVNHDSDSKENKEDDDKDSQSFGRTKGGTRDRTDAIMPVEGQSTHYNMKHKKRGFAVIVAYEEFGLEYLGRRSCAKHDTRVCEEAFNKLNYDVQKYENLNKTEFFDLLELIRKADHSSSDSLVIVFMSHGGVHKNNREFIYTYDAKVNTSELWKNFTPEKCPSLAGKPKLFFIQACRGDKIDKGVQLKKPKALGVETDAIKISNTDYAIPLFADMLMMWASYPGTSAFKTTRNGITGSVFIHFLTKVLEEDVHEDDLMSMLVRVTREVAIHYESHMPKDEDLHKNKQIPQIVSTLMRTINF